MITAKSVSISSMTTYLRSEYSCTHNEDVKLPLAAKRQQQQSRRLFAVFVAFTYSSWNSSVFTGRRIVFTEMIWPSKQHTTANQMGCALRV
jgi:hypothetical protein